MAAPTRTPDQILAHREQIAARYLRGQDQVEIAAAANRKEAVERITAYLRARKTAYMRVFVDGNSTAEDRALVRNDISNFCRKTRSTYDKDPRLSDYLGGRREVALRIDDHLELTVDELVSKLG